MNEMSDYAPDPEHVDLLASVVDEPMTYEKPLRRHAYQEDIIFGHLITGEPLDKFIAEKLYGIGHSSLPSAVSRLARRRKLKISRTTVRDDDEQAYTSYRLVSSPPDHAEEPPMTNTTVFDAGLETATNCRFADAVSVTLGEDGMDIQVVYDGKHIRFRSDQLQYLTMSLAYRADAARKA